MLSAVANQALSQFAKHFKVEEQVQFLKKSKTGIAVGTPARLEALLDNGWSPALSKAAKIEGLLTCSAGALSIEYLKRIVVDASHIDQKKRGIMDMKDTMMPLARWLTRQEFKDRYAAEEKPLDLLFF